MRWLKDKGVLEVGRRVRWLKDKGVLEVGRRVRWLKGLWVTWTCL